MVISMMLGVMSIMSYAELFDDLITGKLTQSYEDSYDFDTELMNSAYQVMSGIDSEQMFETDGKIDEDKLVDIQVYNNSETISGQNESGLSYRLGDLLNWYQKLIYSESTSYVGDTNTDSAELEGNDAEDLKAPIVCKLSDGSYHYYSQDDFNEKVLNGELKFVMTDGIGAETSEQILDELENVDISDRNEMTEEEKNLSSKLQNLMEKEAGKRKLTLQQIENLIQRHKESIQNVSEYDLTDTQEYYSHWNLISNLGTDYTEREFRKFDVDDNNSKLIQFLLYYFNGCRYAQNVFPEENYKVHKNLLLVGEPGTGKTMLMQIFADYLKLTCNPNAFENLSVTQMMNYYKIHGHIDLYTYNENQSKGFKPNPFNICLNDIGLETENQKSYGTSLDSVIDEFLYARYEIFQQYGKKYHITSNLGIAEFKKRFGPRLVDRFKTFNVLPLCGESRRI